MNGIEQGWPQRVSFTSLVRVTKIDLNKNIQVVCMHTRLTVRVFRKIFQRKDNYKQLKLIYCSWTKRHEKPSAEGKYFILLME